MNEPMVEATFRAAVSTVETLPPPLDVFRELAAACRDRVVGAKPGAEPSAFHTDEWEIHHTGDEVLYLLTGALAVCVATVTCALPLAFVRPTIVTVSVASTSASGSIGIVIVASVSPAGIVTNPEGTG